MDGEINSTANVVLDEGRPVASSVHKKYLHTYTFLNVRKDCVKKAYGLYFLQIGKILGILC